MLGLFKSRTERQVLKLERTMMAMEAAADRGKWEAAAYAAKQMLPILREIAVAGEWKDEAINEFLRKRGLVKAVRDPAYEAWLNENMPRFI